MRLFRNVVMSSVCLSTAAFAGTWTPDPSIPNPEQHVRLYEIGRKFAEVNFDADANLIGAGTKNPPNRKKHVIRESAYYAYGLLITGDPADRALAQPILRRVCAAQDTDMTKPTGGAFSWQAEDPPGDLNSAEFVGLALADVIELDRRKPCLDESTRKLVDAAGKLAVKAVMKRDVGADYTNIALLSSALGAAGEKLWSVPGAGKWAEDKLEAIIKLTGDGDFSEYLSPTYSGVDVAGAYANQKYAFSESYAAKADTILNHLWKQLALAYHAPTCNLGGPFCRAYGDNMLNYAAALKYDLYLALDGKYPMPDTETDHGWDKGGLMGLATVPITPRPEFNQTPPAWREWTAAMPNGAPPRRLSQFRDDKFILGTVALQDEWKQKRNLVSYWRTDDTTAPDGFRVGYCIDQTNESIPDGFPPAKMHFYCQQDKATALVALMTPLKPPGGFSGVISATSAVALSCWQ